jgi:peptidoglycan-N-acetylglucosamine deacetylase
MRRAVLAFCLLTSALGLRAAAAAECPGNPYALGVSRTIAIDPTEHMHLGSHQYRESLPLRDHEVVLTFDDGPLPPHSSRVLDILAAECVKATFFLVGRMATSFPHLVQRVHEEGHTLANHSQNHPLKFHKFTVDQAAKEIEDGFTSIRTVVGDPAVVTDFFRIPGLLRQPLVEQYLDGRGVMTWSVDFMADDWHRRLSPQEIVRRALQRIEAKRHGILLLHDIQPGTVIALPEILRELKVRGYKIVHVVQAGPGHPKTASEPEQWIARHDPVDSLWPRPEYSAGALPAPTSGAPSLGSFAVGFRPGAMVPATLAGQPDTLRTADGEVSASELWTRGVVIIERPGLTPWTVPAAEIFRYARVFKPRPTVRTIRTPVARLDLPPALRNPVGHPAAVKKPAPRGRQVGTPLGSQQFGHQIQLANPSAGWRNPQPTTLR